MPELLAFGFPGVPELLVVGLVVLLLFGSRLPSVMRSLGVGITEFRKGIRGEIDADGQQLVEDQIEPEFWTSLRSNIRLIRPLRLRSEFSLDCTCS